MIRQRLAAVCSAGLLIVCAAVSLGAESASSNSVVPLFAIVHPNQLVPPVAGGSEWSHVVMFLDETSRILTLSGTNTEQGTSLELHGPASPGTTGKLRITSPGAQVPIAIGPLTDQDLWLLKRGYMYLEFAGPDGPHARGQILPIAGVSY